MFRDRIMKRHATALILMVFLSSLIGFNSCAKFDNVDDQSPVLIVHIEIAPGSESTIITSETNKVYLVYYTDSTWLAPWLQHGSSSNLIINPSVGTFSTYLAAFWDAQGDGSTPATNGNGVLDPGEPCTGYVNADHGVDEITEMTFLPLEWKEIIITLDTAVTY